MRFQKGQSGNPAGRPKGSLNVDRQNYLDLNYWFKRAHEELAELDSPDKKVSIVLQLLDKILSKISNLPGTPADSVKNAEIAAEVLKSLEQPATRPETVQEDAPNT